MINIPVAGDVTQEEFAAKLTEVMEMAKQFGVTLVVQTPASASNPYRSGTKSGAVYDVLAEGTPNGGLTHEEVVQSLIDRGVYEDAPNTSGAIAMWFPEIARKIGMEYSSRELVIGFDKKRKRVLYGIPTLLEE